MSRFRRHCFAFGFVLQATAGASAMAQTATNGDASATNAPAALEEIVVTAQRRTEGVQRAALAIDVVSAKSIGIAGAARASDLGSLVPALQISESGNAQQSLYLRGVGTFSANSYSDPAVSFNIDGVSIGRPSSMSGVMYDLDRVEVLKGPQGTLYGRNATGGAINVLPARPKLGDTSVQAALTVGNYGQVHPEAAANFAISETSAARVALTYTRHDAYQSDGTGDARNYAGRLQYLFQPSDALSIRVAGDYAHDGGHGAAGTLMALQNPFTGAITPSPLSRDVGNLDPRVGALLGGQYSFISGRFISPVTGPGRSDDKFWGVMSEIVWRTPIGTLTVLPAHRDSKLNDVTSALGFSSTALEHDKQDSIEARLASDDEGFLRWLVGAYYFKEDIDATYQFNQQALAPVQDLNTGTKSKAGFARITLAPTDSFRISGGVRYTEDEKSFDGVSRILISACGLSSPIPACPNAPLIQNATSFEAMAAQLQLFPIFPNALYGSLLPGAETSVFPLITIPINTQQKFTKVTWHAGLEYDVAKDSMLYASVDTGYHAGGVAFAQIQPPYAPEFIKAYSIGSKNRFLNETLQVNVEGFYWKYTNQQIPHGGTDLNGAYVFYTDNAGSSDIKGAELSIKYLLTRHTVVNLDVQYLSAVYDEFKYQVPAGGTNAPPVTSCPFSQTDATHYTVDCAGKTALQAPRWTGNFGIQQTFDVGNYALIGDVNLHTQSESVVGFEMVPVEVQKAYTTTNLSLTLVPSDGKWSAVAFVNNISDERPYGSAYYNSVMSNIGASVGPPRTVGVRVDYRF